VRMPPKTATGHTRLNVLGRRGHERRHADRGPGGNVRYRLHERSSTSHSPLADVDLLEKHSRKIRPHIAGSDR